MSQLELRIALDALNLTAAKFAGLLKVERSTVHRWLTSEQPVPTSVALLLRAMLDHGLTIKDLRL